MIWSKESETHATSSDGRYSVWKWGDAWISEVIGKAKTHPTKAAAKWYCEEQKQKIDQCKDH